MFRKHETNTVMRSLVIMMMVVVVVMMMMMMLMDIKEIPYYLLRSLNCNNFFCVTGLLDKR
jgi:hypothetical protein